MEATTLRILHLRTTFYICGFRKIFCVKYEYANKSNNFCKNILKNNLKCLNFQFDFIINLIYSYNSYGPKIEYSKL